MPRRRVLLVSPAFHRYWESVARALEACGYDVTPFVYDEHRSIGSRVHRKAMVELPTRLGSTAAPRRLAEASTAAALRALEACRPDAVLAIRSDVFLDSFWDAVEARAVPSTLWLYDELARVPHPADRLRRFTEVATYSRHDHRTLGAMGVRARYLPNAFDPYVTPAGRTTASVVFVGARYPGRERTLSALHRRGIDVLAVGRDWSHHPVDRLRTWQLRRPDLPAWRDVARPEAYSLMRTAPATLNLHENQDGFTMRTFEACGVGALQLVDRADVHDLYEPDEEIVTFGSADELTELCRRAATDRPWRDRIGRAARQRTLGEHTFIHRMRHLAEPWAGA